MEKKTFWEQCKEFWNEKKDMIKTGAKALCAGLLIGYCKGAVSMVEKATKVELELLTKIPTPDKIDDDEILYRCLKGRSKSEVEKLMDEEVEYGEMEP